MLSLKPQTSGLASGLFAPSLFASTFLVASLFLSGCTPYSENGLVGDFVSASKCPANGCANQAADQNYISLKPHATTIRMQPPENRIEISGDCYPSTYPRNEIAVAVYQNTGTAVPFDLRNTSREESGASCIKGKFNFVVLLGHLPAAPYTVRMELVGFDAAGARFVNAAGGRASVSVPKAY